MCLQKIFTVCVCRQWALILFRAFDMREDNDESMRCIVSQYVTIHSPLSGASMHESEKRELSSAGDGCWSVTIKDCVVPCYVEELSRCIGPVIYIRYRVTVVPLSSLSKYRCKQQENDFNHFKVFCKY